VEQGLLAFQVYQVVIVQKVLVENINFMKEVKRLITYVNIVQVNPQA